MRSFVFVIDTLEYSGEARLLRSLAPHLKALGHEVRLLVVGKKAPWSSDVQALGIPILHLDSHGIWDIPGLWKLRQWIQGATCDELHVLTLNALEAVGLAAPDWLSRTIFWGAPRRKTKLGFLRKKIIPRVKAILCQTRAQSRLLQQSGLPEKILLTIPPGLQPMDAPESYEPDFLKPFLINTGPFRRADDHLPALWALEILQYILPKIHLCLTGTGKEIQKLQSFSTSLESSKKIHFTGLVGFQEPWIQKASGFLMTNSQPGGFVSVLEAMHLGKPIIAAHVEGIDDFLTDGKNALYFDPGDKAGLARQIRKVWESPALAEDLGRAALALAKEQFQTQHFFTPLLDLLGKI